MSIANSKIEQVWKDNFKKCSLIDANSGKFNLSFARQLFYGKSDDSYPEKFPNNFSGFYAELDTLNQEQSLDKLLIFLEFIGVKMRRQILDLHLEKFPDDYPKLIKKCYYILKTIAHYGENFDINNPYNDLSKDLYFLLLIESEESTLGGQLQLFEDDELPNIYNKFAKLPPGYEENLIVQNLFNRIEESNESVFITGKAGTGKSTFIHYFAGKSKKKVLLLAFTGIAAINVGGQTIHSFFRFPIKPLMPEDDEIFRFKPNSEKYKIIKDTQTIIIDEVSMLRADILEGIDYSLRINGGNPRERFGGKQLLFIGDIFQLPPVLNLNDEVNKFLFTEVYNSEYFFDSLAYRDLNPSYFEFKKSYRQKNDLPFVQLLDEIRICKSDSNSLNVLNNRFDPSYIPQNEDFVIYLMSSNALANAENAKRLNELNYTKFNF